jgi:putative Mg2+ transporter-C (MgtC) family protein
MIRGMTSAAAVFAATGIGVVAGTGHLWLAAFVTLLTIFDLELRNAPILNRLDVHRYSDRMAEDADDPTDGLPPDAPGL